MPEVYLGLAGESSFGISANVLYQFNDVRTGKLINPYIGLGLGFFKLGDTDFGTNFIVGTEIDVLDGKVFVDYSSHNMFDINQFSVGYRFTF
ncbi:hypothetical protein [Balneicella halophila]|uniref:hypothetical protein n=1 Tax=Balneicella halophila TaxID=1537566 RepID=UPI00105778CE|nr:hypothetical protein [Balneicella halophila]